MSKHQKPALLVMALIVIPLMIRFLRPAGTPRIRKRGKTKCTQSIASLHKVTIGGTDQWVMERSENTGNPVVLFLHGGPGTSQLTLNRKNTKALEKYCTVVNWDQRGAGKSYGALRVVENMNIDQFVQDTRELTLYLLKKYGKEKIVLVGHSWGTVIGILAASKYPELYHCYVGIGQMSNVREGELASYQWTLAQAKNRGDQIAVQALEKMGPPPYSGAWQSKFIRQRSYLARYGGEVYGSRYGAMLMVIGSLLFSTEYNLKDCFNFFRGIIASGKLLWQELLQVNLFESVPELRLPVFFMEGRFDQEVPSAIAAHYFEELKAPSKELIWFEKSAHMLNTEERDVFNKALIEKVLPIAGGGILSLKEEALNAKQKSTGMAYSS
jgi:pimeloyl-ACP methyl ester carboxylesterase